MRCLRTFVFLLLQIALLIVISDFVCRFIPESWLPEAKSAHHPLQVLLTSAVDPSKPLPLISDTETTSSLLLKTPVSETLEVSSSKLSFLTSDTVWNKWDYLWWGITGLFALYWILTLIIFLRRTKPMRMRTKSNDLLLIHPGAMIKFVQNKIEEHPAVVSYRVTVKCKRGNPSIHAVITIRPIAPLPEIKRQIEASLHDAFTSIMGIEKLHEISIIVSIDPKSLKHVPGSQLPPVRMVEAPVKAPLETAKVQDESFDPNKDKTEVAPASIPTSHHEKAPQEVVISETECKPVIFEARMKIFDREVLAKLLTAQREQRPGVKTVFTNGCFDLLHAGHVRYLWEARKLGDQLIVAINSDASVRRLKGETRPTLKLEERLEILAGLACVDYVTWFEEDDPLALLEELKPEVLVKGANYSIDEVVGRELVQAWGADVRTLAQTPDLSSSALLEKIQMTQKKQPVQETETVMKKTICGKAYVLGDNVDTDQIIPAEHLVYSLTDPEERKLYGKYALSSVPPAQAGLPNGHIPFVREGDYVSDYTIIIAGRNFGCGSSREHAPFALREAGIKAVIAEFYARIFFRNCVNSGYLIPYETPKRLIDEFVTGDEVEIDLDENIIRNLTKKTEFDLSPLGDILPIIAAGDVFAYAQKSGMTI